MDESKSLEAVADILNKISEKPFDISLHLRHIDLAKRLNDLDSQISAFQMMSQFMAVGDDVWLPFIEAKEKSTNLETQEGVEELLELFERAEGDYLSIPILQKHLNFLIEKHAQYDGEEPKPEGLGDLFSTSWTRGQIQEVVSKGVSHLTQGHLLFDVQRDWELERLEAALPSDKPALLEYLEDIFILRLKQPHSNSDETFQAYSSFTTKYKSPVEYESRMVAASKLRGSSVKAYDRRESLEASLAQTNNSLEGYAYYIGYERRAKYPDLFTTRGIYERAVAEAAKRRRHKEQGAEQALAAFWTGYSDAMRLLDVGVEVEQVVFQRALRSVPGSGEVWARYLRFLERAPKAMDAPGDLESVSDAYNRAMNTSLVQSNIEQLIPLTLAYAGYEKRIIEAGEGTEDSFPILIAAVEAGIEAVSRASKEGDPKFRLEKFLAGVYEDAGLADGAIAVWRTAAQKYKSSYTVWINYTDALVRHDQSEQARAVFTEVHTKRLDWPEAVWEAWLSFEHLSGSAEDIDACLDKIEKAQYQTNARRAKEAEKAYQAAAEAQANVLAPPQAPTSMDVDSQPSKTVELAPMEVDAQPVSAPESNKKHEGSKKRTAEAEPSETHKKARFDTNPPPLKRDRENTTVFVADLSNGVTEDELKALFKDCGGVREVKITKLPTALVALVEFYERDSVPPALTKDKKRLRDQEIAVHLAWRSTLYVTNFPESADDVFVRDLFGKYGTIFDVRWPSKKFKNTRRFCYVQFTSPESAQKALELHGRELEPNLPLNVYVSNPERKKERTDQDANEREIYVAGLSRYTTKPDLEKLFATYGKVKDVRMATDQDGHARGFAFVEYEDPQDARKALDANNYELKKRRIAVTLTDPRVRAKHHSDIGLGRAAEARIRSVRVRNLPPGTQEGLLEQTFQKIVAVRRVEIFADKQEAVIELENAAEAGKLLLHSEPVVFNGNTLAISEEVKDGAARPAAPPPKTGGLFVPRKAGSRPRAGLGHARAPPPATVAGPSSSSSKGQDAFRQMLG